MKVGMQVGLDPAHIVLDGDPPPPTQRGTVITQFWAHICCGQMAGWIKMPLGMEVGLDPCDFVLDGDPAPLLQKGAESLPKIFGPCLLWPKGCMDEYWHGGRPQLRRLCIRWGPSTLTQKGAEQPAQFSAHFYCGQTAGCIKMPLGMDVGLSPGDFMINGDPVPPPQKGVGALQVFGPYLL